MFAIRMPRGRFGSPGGDPGGHLVQRVVRSLRRRLGVDGQQRRIGHGPRWYPGARMDRDPRRTVRSEGCRTRWSNGLRSPSCLGSGRRRAYASRDVDERVLVVEDDASIREMTALGLGRAGFRVTTAGDGREGLMRARHDPFDAVILDVMLPSLDGFEILRELRRDSRIPVIMLTARTDTTDLEVDPAGFVARRAGRPLDLTATEFRLLLELVRHPGRVLTREVLLSRVWSYDYLGDSRLVDVAVQRLRAKVEDDPARPAVIRTVRGVGYRLERPGQDAEPGSGEV